MWLTASDSLKPTMDVVVYEFKMTQCKYLYMERETKQNIEIWAVSFSC